MIDIKKSLIALLGISVTGLCLTAGGVNYFMTSANETMARHVNEDVALERNLTALFNEGLGLRIAHQSRQFNPDGQQPYKSHARAREEIMKARDALLASAPNDLEVRNIVEAMESWIQYSDAFMTRDVPKTQAHIEDALSILEEVSLDFIMPDQLDSLSTHLTSAQDNMNELFEQEVKAWQAFRKPLIALVDRQREKTVQANAQALIERDKAALISGLIVILFVVIQIAVSIVFIRRITAAMGGTLADAFDVAGRISRGDLSKPIDVKEGDETSLMASMRVMQNSLSQLLKVVQSSVDHVAQTSVTVRDSASASRAISNDQGEHTQTIASAMTEMSASVQEVAHQINMTADAATNAQSQARGSMKRLHDTVNTLGDMDHQIKLSADTVDTLQTQTQGINNIVKVIRDIADQTNLLALNAAIEAARAGEQGRGFAVVADEVRSLARRSSESAQEITDVIKSLIEQTEVAHVSMGESREKTRQTVEHAKATVDDLQLMLTAMDQIVEMSAQIASAADEQSAVASDIDHRMVVIHDMSISSQDALNSTFTAIEDMNRNTQALKAEVSRFSV